ncbi:MAG: hypothetical protein R3F49_05045 [Planctomycetota bacterium]
MLGVTSASEDHDKTEQWIKDLGVEYTYGYFTGNALSEATEHKGYPHCALINPEGVVVWTGHPSALSKSTIEEHLKGASKYVMYGWSEEFEPVAKALVKLDYAKAIGEIEKLSGKGVEGTEAVKASVLGMLDGRIGEMTKAFEAGDYYAAQAAAEALNGKIKGLAQEATVASLLANLSSDKAIKEVLDGQTKLQKIVQGELRKKKQIEDAIGRAQQIAKKYEGTIVERQAKDFVGKMRSRLGEG